jgi:NitT/TauT family transport system substrate-binding protein
VVVSTSPYIDYAPYFVAKDKGYFDAFQIDAELTVGSGSTAEILPLLAAGRVTVAGISLSAGFFNAVNTGSSVVVLTPQATIPHSCGIRGRLAQPSGTQGQTRSYPRPGGIRRVLNCASLAIRRTGHH